MAKTNLLSPRFVEHLVSSRIKSDNVFIVSSKWDCFCGSWLRAWFIVFRVQIRFPLILFHFVLSVSDLQFSHTSHCSKAACTLITRSSRPLQFHQIDYSTNL